MILDTLRNCPCLTIRSEKYTISEQKLANNILIGCAIIALLTLLGSLVSSSIWEYGYWNDGTKTSAVCLILICIYLYHHS